MATHINAHPKKHKTRSHFTPEKIFLWIVLSKEKHFSVRRPRGVTDRASRKHWHFKRIASCNSIMHCWSQSLFRASRLFHLRVARTMFTRVHISKVDLAPTHSKLYLMYLLNTNFKRFVYIACPTLNTNILGRHSNL